jgi:N-acetylmuramoyl-L-alanine amidase
MIFDVRNYFLLFAFAIATGLFPLAAGQSNQQPNQAAPQPAAPSTPAPQLQQSPAPAVAPSGPVIVLDPAHGGTDLGARGANGIAEKDIVLQFARTTRAELAHQGIRAVMTRDDDSNPSYDARAAIANAYRDAIFISIHVSSTGNAGTARAYYYQFSNSRALAQATPTSTDLAPPAVGFTPWADAQRQYTDMSHYFADTLQHELGLRFSGSPAISTGVAIRGLESVAAPTVAVEISSMAVSDPGSLLPFSGSLATSISHAILAFRPPGSAETK